MAPRDVMPAKHRNLGTTLILLALLGAGAVAACGPVTPEAAPVPAGPTPTVTVPFELPMTIAITGRFAPETLAVLDEQIAAFEEANPDVRVAVVSALPSGTKRHAQFASQLGASNASNDIYVLDPAWLAEFDASGWLVHLDAFAEQEAIELDDFLPSTLQTAQIGGHLVALPWLADGGMLYYRRDLLEEHGFEPPARWEDLVQIALEVKDKEGLPYGFVWQGEAYESLTCNTLEHLWARGGDVLDESGNPIFDSPETQAALQQMADLIALDVSPAEIVTYDEGAALAAFQNGEAVFMRNWAYAWDRLNGTDSPVAGQVGLAPLPSSCLGGVSLALAANSLYPEQALRFIAFLARYEQQLQMARQGIEPSALATVYDDTQLLARKPVAQDLYAALSVTRPRPPSPAYMDISEVIYTEVHRLLLGQQDAAATAAEVQRRIEAALQ